MTHAPMTDELHTPRLLLRRARMADLADIHAVLGEPRAMRYWSTPHHETLDQSRVWLENMVDQNREIGDDFVIEHQGRVIGKAGAWALPEVGFILHPAFWGKGLAHEAMAAVIPHLFATHDVGRLTAEVDPRNAASLSLLGRLGFRETGRAQNTMLWGDEWCDSVYLALPRPEET